MSGPLMLCAAAASKMAASKRGRSSRRKGGAGEREFCSFAERWFPEVKRNLSQCRGGGAGEGGDIQGILGWHLEIKRHARCNLPAALRQAIADAKGEARPVAFCRDDRGEWVGVIRAEDLLELMAEIAHMQAKLAGSEVTP